jgi:hypothetical protein
MRWFRFLGCFGFILYLGIASLEPGASAQQKAPPSQPAPISPPTPKKAPPPPPPPKAEPKAEKFLANAIDAQDPQELGPVEMDFWEKVATGGIGLEANGRYLAGTDRRMRLEFKIRLGGTEAESLIVSDGTTVWNMSRVGTGQRSLSKWDMKKVQETLLSPGTAARVSVDFYRSEGFAGVVPLLSSLGKPAAGSAQMTFTTIEDATWKDATTGQTHKVVKLTAVWSPDITKYLAPHPNPWPALFPRTCQLYLDAAKPYWLYRLEWWGPTTSNAKADSLLSQMEFRNPRQAKPEAKAFAFDAGGETVADKTQEKITRIIQARNRLQTMNKGGSSQPTPAK